MEELQIPPRTMSLAAAAARYAQQGLRVFPCAPEQKRPLTENGFHDATTSPTRIESWWRSWPWANIGIATGGDGIDVLDVDIHPTGNGYASLATLEDAGLVDGWAAKIRTPSGGLHLYFPADPAFPQQNWAVTTAHIDFRGEGGYIIAPPSIGARSTRYEAAATAPSGRPVDATRIRDLLAPPPPTPPAGWQASPDLTPEALVRRIARWVEQQPEGNRNRALFWASCRLAERALPEPYAHGALGQSAQRAGLTATEATVTIRSAYRTVSSARSFDLDEGPPPPARGL